jgi:hypothetical protein
MQSSADVTNEGIEAIERFLRTWASSRPTDDMGYMDPAGEVNELKRCFEQFRPAIEGNAWAQSVLASL